MTDTPSGRPKMRVLVIDDDDIAREQLCSTLQAAGHETFELQSSIGATRCIHEQKVDAVVLDVMLPTVNGDNGSRPWACWPARSAHPSTCAYSAALCGSGPCD